MQNYGGAGSQYGGAGRISLERIAIEFGHARCDKSEPH